jgi:hypothetical protein
VIWRRQHNIILQLQLSIRVPLKRLEIHDQIVLDSEHGIGSQIWVVFGEYLRRNGDITVAANHQMDVSRAHRMAIKKIQQKARRAIGRQGIGRRAQAVEMILAILISPELPPQIVIRLILGVLEIVFAVGARLPDVDDDAGDALLGGEVGDGAVHEGDVALVRVLDDAAAQLAEGGVGTPEGAQDGGGGGEDAGFGGDFVGDFVDEAGVC